MGWAVVSMTDVRVRQAILEDGSKCTINGIKIGIKPYTNKETKEEVPTDLFLSWSKQVGCRTCNFVRKNRRFFDSKHKEITSGWKAAEEDWYRAEEKLRAEEQERRQQEQVLRKRTEQPATQICSCRFCSSCPVSQCRIARLRRFEEQQPIPPPEPFQAPWQGDCCLLSSFHLLHR
ncbi:unnamed protein product [Symbiodinium sp. CCMP2592]|nr:unnamed protein product [Symbiodinium sp. CCMP2592]